MLSREERNAAAWGSDSASQTHQLAVLLQSGPCWGVSVWYWLFIPQPAPSWALKVNLEFCPLWLILFQGAVSAPRQGRAGQGIPPGISEGAELCAPLPIQFTFVFLWQHLLI